MLLDAAVRWGGGPGGAYSCSRTRCGAGCYARSLVGLGPGVLLDTQSWLQKLDDVGPALPSGCPRLYWPTGMGSLAALAGMVV